MIRYIVLYKCIYTLHTCSFRWLGCWPLGRCNLSLISVQTSANCRVPQGLVTWRMAKAVTLPQLSWGKSLGGTKGNALQHFPDWISAIFQPMPSWFLLISAVLPLWAPRAELSPSPRLQEKLGYLAEEVGLHWQSEMSLRSALAFHIIPLILDTCWRRESL